MRQVSIETCPANQSLGTPFMVVNGNYRLGPFGFGYGQEYLSDGASNSGLWDVLAVFDWVAANIASFGGNADHVTLAGQSAGAVSASLMALVPNPPNIVGIVSETEQQALHPDPQRRRTWCTSLGADCRRVSRPVPNHFKPHRLFRCQQHLRVLANSRCERAE